MYEANVSLNPTHSCTKSSNPDELDAVLVESNFATLVNNTYNLQNGLQKVGDRLSATIGTIESRMSNVHIRFKVINIENSYYDEQNEVFIYTIDKYYREELIDFKCENLADYKEVSLLSHDVVLNFGMDNFGLVSKLPLSKNVTLKCYFLEGN